MKFFKSYARQLTWLFMALLLPALVLGCGDGNGVSSDTSVTDKSITEFSLSGVAGSVNETTKNITVVMPVGTDVAALVAVFKTSGANVKIGTVGQTSGVTPNDFTTPLIYTVTAADNSTVPYTVTVNVTAASTKAITAYSLAGATGTINESAKTIAVTLPSGTIVSALAATFTKTGTSVKVGATVQTSGTTANNFTNPVTYTVTAADNSTVTYVVTVTLAATSAKTITAYSLARVTGTINETVPKTIAVTLPSGTPVTAQTATFTTTGTNVKVGTAVQTSGTTTNNFTNPVTYTVTAADNSSVDYIVTVTVALAQGPAAVDLGAAGNFVILAKTGIDTVPSSAITGDIGASPVAATFITGFSLTADATNVFSRSTQVTGKVYAANYAVPTPSNLTTAVLNMETAYTAAAGRTTPDFTELHAGDLSGKTLVPGLYKWGTGVLINSDVTLKGGPNDVWIFQIAGDITQANGTRVILDGGALPKNIFWQVAGGTGVAIGTTAHFEGVILAIKAITLNTGASVNGRLLSQTAVTLKANAVTQPAP